MLMLVTEHYSGAQVYSRLLQVKIVRPKIRSLYIEGIHQRTEGDDVTYVTMKVRL